jgi:hypothetical protein
MGKEFFLYIDSTNVYACKDCKTHFSSKPQLISKAFKGKFGRSFLMDQMINVNEGPSEEKILLTGVHVVKDVFCKGCKTYVGWTYVKAFEPSEKYKEGKFILERNQAIKLEWDY